MRIQATNTSVDISDRAARELGVIGSHDLNKFPYNKAVSPYMRRVPRRILIADDFEATTLKWETYNGTVTRDTTTAQIFEGAAAMKLLTGAVAGNKAEAARRVGFSGFSKTVIECWWAMSAVAATTPRRFTVQAVADDGVNQRIIGAGYLKNLTTPQNKWQFTGDGITFADVTGGAEVIPVSVGTAFPYHYLRAHFDLSLNPPQLTELHTDSLDLTGLAHAGSTPGTSFKSAFVDFLGETDAAAASTFFVDLVTTSDQEV